MECALPIWSTETATSIIGQRLKMDSDISPLLRVEEIDVVYDNIIHSLRELTLKVARGTIVALLGANGAGKSTTLKAISNALLAEGGRIVRGDILFDGVSTKGCEPAQLVRCGIAHVLEGRRIFEPLTVEENLRTGAYSRRD